MRYRPDQHTTVTVRLPGTNYKEDDSFSKTVYTPVYASDLLILAPERI